ncbi:hypothetical protein DTL21_27785 [Bremerella cremea]|uniref:PNPLA domain-containing protein n=1 Tax=Blastopirellula marina TaxID=124 RepID=A0A2S8FCE8_9BACT|nr:MULTISPECIES: CBASS cGAMP-activated phospholipase [Pirellulaceae]PQO29835.1 hypothetical protein C5Y83_27740 [Blastopirellula marina]RCS43137.1 hypothetical protein DTL21_27785 [Bremerella cremea]
MFRILSLPGGGLRGAFAIEFLAEIEQRLDHAIGEYFDLIAGTSTGSITASALCHGMTAKALEDFYNDYSEQIFRPREPYRPSSALRPIYSLLRSILAGRSSINLDHFFQSRYCPFSLNDALEAGFGDCRLSELSKSRLLVPSVNLSDGKTRVFRTPHLPRRSDSHDWRVVDVIIASAAAPTYFPHKTMPDGKSYVDGGLWANDPGLAAISETVRITEQCRREEDVPFNLSDIWMLSLGTGQSSYSLSPPNADAGMLYWSRHIAEVMSISQVQGTQLPLRFVLESRYRQVDFDLNDPTWTLDNTAATGELFQLGHERASELFSEIRDPYFLEPTTPFVPFNQ